MFVFRIQAACQMFKIYALREKLDSQTLRKNLSIVP